ncbi:hypothetical protein CXF64_14680 [Pseudoalteromonas sp. GutCa3]|nr:hypothetical protein CXF75_01825 [Pseudoalteromonas arctica]PKG69660.1 hypothetical protein CXF64_14680 [Pseudoalteromonas sp. GutCa3]
MKFFMLGAMIMAVNIVCAATYTFESWPENGKHCEFSFDSAPTTDNSDTHPIFCSLVTITVTPILFLQFSELSTRLLSV